MVLVDPGSTPPQGSRPGAGDRSFRARFGRAHDSPRLGLGCRVERGLHEQRILTRRVCGPTVHPGRNAPGESVRRAPGPALSPYATRGGLQREGAVRAEVAALKTDPGFRRERGESIVRSFPDRHRLPRASPSGSVLEFGVAVPPRAASAGIRRVAGVLEKHRGPGGGTPGRDEPRVDR